MVAGNADGNYRMTGAFVVSDADQDTIQRVDLEWTGSAAFPKQSISVNMAPGTYPLVLLFPGSTPAGPYTLSAVAYDAPGGASEAKTATFTLR